MKQLKLGILRAALVAALFVAGGFAQTVQISDTLFNANGTFASGRIVVTTGTPFTTSGGVAVGLAPIQYTIPNTGVINLSLYPNVGSTPTGTSYQARYILNSGAQYTETWVVPASGPVTLSAVRVNTVPSPTVFFLPSQLGAVDSPADEECYTYEATGSSGEWQPCASGGSGHTIQDEGVGLTSRANLNLIGGGVSCVDNAGNDATDCTISGSGASHSDEEGPAGAVNGSNVTYTLSNAPSPATSLTLVLNGLVLRSGAGNDFTISGTTITMNYAPTAGSNFVAWYRY